ncbi:MAG: penicillin acylase family protein, partial [Pseudomonadota bacterium]
MSQFWRRPSTSLRAVAMPGPWPPEFYLMRSSPEPWKPADSLVWGRLMGMQLSSNWRNELLRVRMIKLLGGADKIAPLWPPYPGDGPVTIPKQQQGLYKDMPLDRLWAALPHELISKGASNQWVIHGRNTNTGKPILANDPHLGLSVPTLWYLARIEAPGLSLTGATVPGVPIMILGHNGRVAWGVTTTYIDTDDLFLEKLDPADPNRYITPDGPKPFVTRKETIKVRGERPFVLTVRETRHGPVVSDAMRDDNKAAVPKGHVFALSAPWLRGKDTTPDALYDLNRARDALGVVAALRKYQSPPQNFVFADVGGNIGYYAAGLIPIRKTGNGFLPSPGWTGAHDWTGFIPFDELPRGLNPPGGVFVNANNKSVSKDYPYFLSNEWGDFYRAQRITELLNSQPRKTIPGSMGIQKDA